MNILYIDHYAGSLKHGMEFRPYYLSREWVADGHKVRIVGGDYSHLRKENPTVSKSFETEELDGIEYQWIKTGSYEGNGVKRALTMFRFVAKLWLKAGKLAREFKPDAVISSSTYPLDCYAARRIAKKAKCKYVHEGHDIWPLTLTEVGGMGEHNPFVIAMGIAEKHAYKTSDRVVSVLPFSYLHMLDKGLRSKDVFSYIPNGIVLDDWSTPEKPGAEVTEKFESLHSEGKFVVCYIGGHAISNSLDVLIEAAEKMKDNGDVAFVLIGKGTEKERLKTMAEDMSLTNVHFLPPVNKLAVPTVLEMADALYIGAKRCTLYRYGVSMNKVYDYMMSAKPIVYGVEAANNEVAEAGAGITIEPDSAEAIAGAVLALKDMTPEERAKMGQNGKTWVIENCDYRVLAKRFIDVIEGIEKK